MPYLRSPHLRRVARRPRDDGHEAVHGVEDSAVLNESSVALARLRQVRERGRRFDLRALDLEAKQAVRRRRRASPARGALGVPYLFYTSLAKVGSKYVMHYKVMAVEEAGGRRGMKTAA